MSYLKGCLILDFKVLLINISSATAASCFQLKQSHSAWPAKKQMIYL